ncbi:MAG: type II toxin-antitoxin system mRNA interferase toxin, RelE/StbE family [Candidatus Micrarchaeota archaeon]|nr:type II toxin-antitoxin system mRNA interferase toxin, RelE/StbE family [Candidatus Micrarchaeota archaeon]
MAFTLTYLITHSDHFLETMKKLRKKDQPLYERVKKIMAEIIDNPEHYKPLSNKLKHYRRAHVGSFVIAFRIIEQEKTVKFVDYDHHDNIYEKPFNE